MTIKDDITSPPPPEFPRQSPQAEREVRRDTALRQARSCYDHLAGVAGVRLFAQLLDNGWIESAGTSAVPKPDYRLTDGGTAAMAKRGIDPALIQKAKRRFAYGCTDWTERQHHLGGGLGAAILASLVDGGYVIRVKGTRVVGLLRGPSEWVGTPD